MVGAASPLSPVPSRIGRYEVLCELGRGGMAVLYLARTSGPGGFERLFAVKMIHEHLGSDPKFVRMFLDEARLAARIRHPNVVPVYEVDVEDGRYYIAMEYVSGETLGKTLAATWPVGRTFPLGLAMHVVAMAAEGLHAAHELTDAQGTRLGVIHRDVSPQNIMLGYDGTIRVMDFGVARALDQVKESNSGALKGTLAYMAPEQLRAASAADRRSDVFSLGVVLWETCTGRRLFKSTTDMKTARRVLQAEVKPASSLRPEVPAALDAVILQALARDPEQRYPTARALGEALQEVLAQSGRRVSSGDLEGLMRSVFAERMQQRREMERKAAQGTPPADLAPLGETGESAGLMPNAPDDPIELADDEVEEVPPPARDGGPIDIDTGLVVVGRSFLDSSAEETTETRRTPPAEDDDDTSQALVLPVADHTLLRNVEPTQVVRPRPSRQPVEVDPVLDPEPEIDPSPGRRRAWAMVGGAVVLAGVLIGVWIGAAPPAHPRVTAPPVAARSAPPPAPEVAAAEPAPAPESPAPEEEPQAAPVETATAAAEIIDLTEGTEIEAEEPIVLPDPVAPRARRAAKPARSPKRITKKWTPQPSTPGLFSGSDL